MTVVTVMPDESGYDYEPTGEAATKSSRKRARSELQVAIEVRRVLGKPIATICSPGSDRADLIYTYTPDTGWTIDDTVASLADKIHGSNGQRIMGIVNRAFALPTHAMSATSFFQWQPDPLRPDPDFYGRWVPFDPRPDQAFFADGWISLDDPATYHPYLTPTFGPMITVPYESTARSDLFTQAVDRHFADRPDEYRRFQQEMGKILQPHVPNKYELYLISRIRDNGKSALANAIAQAPAGPAGFATLSQKEMSEDRFALAGLLNRFANVSSDSGHARGWSNTLLALTSGPVSIRMMHRAPFSVMLSAKLINTCNTMQVLDDRAGNMQNRIKVIEMRGPAYPRDAKGGDVYLNSATWNTHEIRSAIVAWMFEGLIDLWQNGPANSDAAKAEIERRINESDPERAMFLDLIRPDPNEFTSARDLCDRLWPGQIIDKRAETKFGMVLATRMFALFGLESVRKKVDNKIVRGYAVSVAASD